MARGAAARRYAKALFELAKEADQLGAVRSELESLSTLLEKNQELADVLLRPLHPVAQRRRVLEAVAERLGAGPLLKSFNAFLIDQRRLVDLATIREEFERRVDAEAGLTKARVRAASPLGDAQAEALRRVLGARTGRQVQLEIEIDESLIGGVVAQVGDLLFDGSLRTQLRQLQTSLIRL